MSNLEAIIHHAAAPLDPQAVRHLGLDLGTTNTSLCTTGYNTTAGQFDVPSPTRLDGGNFLRSAILFDDAGEPLAFGQAAYRHPYYLARPDQLREEFKLQLGDASREGERLSRVLVAEVARRALLQLGLTSFAEDKYQTTVGVPARWIGPEYFRAEAVLRAVSDAGLPNVAIQPEPVAAVYLHARLGQLIFEDYPQLWLVIDIGGGTTDLAIVETQPGGALPVVRYTDGLRFGGRDFDHVFQAWLFRDHWPTDAPPPTPAEEVELLAAARDFKEKFSQGMARNESAYTGRVTIRGHGRIASLSRATFESAEMAEPLIRRFDLALHQVLLRAGRPASAIDRVILTGGSARWYFVRRAAERRFGRQACLLSDEPELAIAQGLALARTQFVVPMPETIARLMAAAPPPPDPETIELTSVATETLDLAECRHRAQRIVYEKALVAGGVALVLSPIPGVSQIPLTSIEAKMVYDVALIYGYKLDERQIIAVVGSLLAGGTVAKIAVMEAATFVPVIGTIVKTTVGGGAALAFGRLAIEYFEKRRQAEQTGAAA